MTLIKVKTAEFHNYEGNYEGTDYFNVEYMKKEYEEDYSNAIDIYLNIDFISLIVDYGNKLVVTEQRPLCKVIMSNGTRYYVLESAKKLNQIISNSIKNN